MEYSLNFTPPHSTPGAVNFYRKHGYRADEGRVEHDHEGIAMVKDRPHVFLELNPYAFRPIR